MRDRRTTEDAREAGLRAVEHEFAVLLRRIRRNTAARAAEVHPDLTAASFPLLSSLFHDGPQRASALACAFSLDKGAVSRVIGTLLDLGLVERSPDPHDGRASILRLSADGTRRMKQAEEWRSKELDDRLADWTAADFETLAAKLARLNEAAARAETAD